MIKKGDVVRIHYSGRFEDGEVFDSSEGRAPLEFTAGEGMVIKGLDEEIIGMRIGEKKTLTIPPEKAYGNRQEGLLVELPRQALPENLEMKKGTQISFRPKGNIPFTGTIISFDGDSVRLDLNHPLAGKTLVFDIEVVGVR